MTTFSIKFSTAACIALILTSGYIVAQTTARRVMHTVPPLYGFFSKCLDSRGIPVRSSEEVADSALRIASTKIELMLKHMAEARYNLMQWGAEMHVIGKNQQTSDLPEYRSEKGRTYTDTRGVSTTIDERTRGKGGIYTSCGEENLLGLKEDRYAGGSDICIHEFAHAIMDFGLDEQLEMNIAEQFRRSIGLGLWKGAYAAVDQGEYWAELSMWYFGAHGEFLSDTKLPAPGPEGLRAYDPDGYALMDSIYSGRLRTKLTKVTPAHKLDTRPTYTKPGEKAYLMIVNDTGTPFKVGSLGADGRERTLADVQPFTRAIAFTRIGEIFGIRGAGKIGWWRVNTKYSTINPEPLKSR